MADAAAVQGLERAPTSDDDEEAVYRCASRCMRCGLCLPECPTYVLTLKETSSPRGRVALLRAVAEGNRALAPALHRESLLCLGCRACATACPAGVSVGPLMEHVRGIPSSSQSLGLPERIGHLILREVVPNPARLEALLLLARGGQWLGARRALRHLPVPGVAGDLLARSDGLMPSRLQKPVRQTLLEVPPPRAPRRGRVAYFLGCVMNVLFPQVVRETVSVLSWQGFEVVVAQGVTCCGAPHVAEGEPETARALALKNIAALKADEVDAIVTDCAGCGAALKDYEQLLLGHVDSARVQAFCHRVRDISEFLTGVGLRTEALGTVNMTAAYHDPCHLIHGQGISSPPRELLRQIPGVRLASLETSALCCGSAGTWGLRHLEMSRELTERKVRAAQEAGATAIVTANPGCHLELTWGAAALGSSLPVYHVTEVLGEAVRRSDTQ